MKLTFPTHFTHSLKNIPPDVLRPAQDAKPGVDVEDGVNEVSEGGTAETALSTLAVVVGHHQWLDSRHEERLHVLVLLVHDLLTRR